MASYDDKTVTELRELATERDLEGRSGMDKAQLIAALEADDAAGGAAPATGDGEIPPEGRAEPPKVGETRDMTGEVIAQVGKHPDLPPDMPVAAGTALDPALPPLEPQQTTVE